MANQPLILFVQTAHSAEDDRVKWHQIPTLEKVGYRTEVVSTLGIAESTAATLGWIHSRKREMIQKAIRREHPKMVICDTPYAVMAVKKTQEQCIIIFDVTEWYPSKKNLQGNAIIVPLKRLAMEQLNEQACEACDAFIFGEPAKGKPILTRWPKKPHILLPYYPREDYVPYREPRTDFFDNTFRLFYAGPATQEKGFDDTMEVARLVAKKRPNIRIVLTIVSNSDRPSHIGMTSNLEIDWQRYLPYTDFCNILQAQDFFLDLRENDSENTQCLPIKIFYYMAAGRPMAYTRLKTICEYITDSSEYLYLSEPGEHTAIADFISGMIDDHVRYAAAGRAARERYLRDFRWEGVEEQLVNFIQKMTE